jgi:hypothetical protein
MSNTGFAAADDEERGRHEEPPERRAVTGDREENAEPSPERLDVLLTVLSEPRRRRVVEYVRDNERATLAELAEFVAERESPDRPPVERIELSLYHSHLPRLVEADLLAYDGDRTTVRQGEQFDVTTLLE